MQAAAGAAAEERNAQTPPSVLHEPQNDIRFWCLVSGGCGLTYAKNEDMDQRQAMQDLSRSTFYYKTIREQAYEKGSPRRGCPKWNALQDHWVGQKKDDIEV